MRKLYLLLVLIVSAIVVNAQSRIHELGLSYSGVDLLGIRYKVGNENSQFRLTVLNVGGLNGNIKGEDSETRTNSQGIAFNVGFQKSNPVADNIFFFYGADLLSSFDNRNYKNVLSSYSSTDKTMSTGLGCVLGFAYYFSDNVNLSAEILPSIWYSNTKSTNISGGTENSNTSKRIGYGFNREGNSFANLTLSFRLKPRQDK